MINMTRSLLVALPLLIALSLACAPGGGATTGALDKYLLADELRQTSDDLTRMARLYSVTGEQRYRDYFERILAIRRGEVARPARPYGPYWDIAVDTGQLPPADGETVPLLKLLEDAGLTDDQLNLVKLAEKRSDELAELEEEAFSGDLEQAREILHGPDYNRHKAEIMEPIDRLLQSLLQK